MSDDSETPWVTNPYICWRHPVARIAAATLLIILDICVYGTDPINESRVEGNMPGIGTIYNFLFRWPANGRLLSRLGLIFLCLCTGVYIGRQWIHHRLLRDACGLSMFAGSGGSFLAIGFSVAGACLAGGAVYNLIIPQGTTRVTGETDMEARTFGKILQISSAVAHTVAALQVTDGVLQDRQRYPNWARGLKQHWRHSQGGYLRILCAWAIVAALTGFFLWSISISSDTWGNLNEIARVFFASFLIFFDLFVVVQDWEFPTLQPPPDLELPILITGYCRPSLHCGAGSRLLRCSQRREGTDYVLPSPTRVGVAQFFNLTISWPWLTYGPLFCALCLDLLGLLAQMNYSPQDYGQYIDPSSHRIWTITDKSHLLSAYDSGVLRQPLLVSWAARRNASTGLPLSASAATDVLVSASWLEAVRSWKILAAMPGIFMICTFLPLIFMGERVGSRPNGRPPLREDPDSEVLRPPALVITRSSDDDDTYDPPCDGSVDESKNPSCLQTPKGFGGGRSGEQDGSFGFGFEQTAPPPPQLPPPMMGTQPVLLSNGAESLRAGADPRRDAPLRNAADASKPQGGLAQSNLRIKRPTSPNNKGRTVQFADEVEAQKERAKQELRKRFGEVGHFDVLLRKECKPLGLTFKLPEAVCNIPRPTSIHQALVEDLQLTVPDGSEPLNFGRYKGMAMRDVADNFPKFCQSTLEEEEQESCDPSPDLLRFAMYLRMARYGEFQDEAREKLLERETHEAKEARTLLVVDIDNECVLDDYNRAQAAAGAWDRIVLPGMHISAVNGIRRDPLAMASALCKTEVLTVRFLYLREVEVLERYDKMEALHVNDKTQRLLEERVSKLVRMEGTEIANSMRSQAEWEAMAASLACALVKEVYKGDRLLQLPPATQPQGTTPGLPLPAADSPSTPSSPVGLPPALPLLPGATSNGSNEGVEGELSDSEESV